MLNPIGYLGALTERLFLAQETFERYRDKVALDGSRVITLLDLWYDVLDEAMNRTAAYVISKAKRDGALSIFFDLKSSSNKEESLRIIFDRNITTDKTDTYIVNLKQFRNAPRRSILYKLPSHVVRHFSQLPSFGEAIGCATQGLITGDNQRFVRFTWEVSESSIGKKWFVYAKGGDSDAYYKAHDYVVQYDQVAKHFYDDRGRHQGQSNYFKSGISWGDVSQVFQAQFIPSNAINSQVSYSLPIADSSTLWSCVAYLNSGFVLYLLSNIYDGHHWGTRNIQVLPWQQPRPNLSTSLSKLAKIIHDLKAAWDTGNEICTRFTTPWLLQLADTDGEAFETGLREVVKLLGWKGLAYPITLEAMLAELEEIEQAADAKLQQLQAQIDETVYELYEISPADRALIERELGERPPELVWPQMEGKAKVEKRREHVRRLLSYFILQALKADADGIVPLVEGTGQSTVLDRLREGLEAAFTQEIAFKLEDEARHILGKTLEVWLEREFSQWHAKLYKNRPILWHLASPQGTFSALVYYHKLDRDTLRKVRNVYLWTLRDGLQKQLIRARDAKDNKTIDRLETALDDLTVFDERLGRAIEAGYAPVIDDGVKVNILPLQEAGVLKGKVV